MVPADPGNFIAQADPGAIHLAEFVEAVIAPRHVDLRPFVLSEVDWICIVPGHSTRGRQSSYGSGTTDIWAMDA